MIDNSVEFSCPHCGEMLSILLDITGGERQEFIYDCEVCCKPIQIQFEVEDGEIINFTAESSD